MYILALRSNLKHKLGPRPGTLACGHKLVHYVLVDEPMHVVHETRHDNRCKVCFGLRRHPKYSGLVHGN